MRIRIHELLPVVVWMGCTPASAPVVEKPAASAGPTAALLAGDAAVATATATATSSAGDAAASRPDEHGPPEPLRVDLIAALCKAAQCSGKLAEVEVWRTAQGKVGRYVHHGDITSCSHSPTTVFDASGKQVGVIPMQAVEKGSAEEKRFTELRKSLLGDNRKVETADCTGRVTPR